MLCLAVSTYGTIWHVHPDSTISSIQAGIDSSSHGDTVLAYPEAYVENINFKGKNIVVSSLYLTTGDSSYISSTIIDGNSSGSVVIFANGEDSTAVITGFTVLNGRAGRGGGIRCDASSPSLTNVRMQGNIADENGGGIFCDHNSNPSLTNVTISGNTAEIDGAGLYCRNNSSPSLTNVTISGNFAERVGGGISCWLNSNPSLVNVAINENISRSGAGGISCWLNSNPSLTNVTVAGNWGLGDGGGISCYSSSPSLTNVTVAGNCGSVFGGGIYCYNSSPSLTNVTVSGNRAWDGGGIFLNNSSSSLVNCIFWNDNPDEICLSGTSSVSVTYSDIQGGWTGTGNIDSDPLFADTANADFSLTENSPCIDAGTPDTTGLNLPPWDILGNQRIWDGDGDEIAIIDMGAYEYGAPPYTGIDDRVVSESKTRSFLHNYPNPFSPQTAAQYYTEPLRGWTPRRGRVYSVGWRWPYEAQEMEF